MSTTTLKSEQLEAELKEKGVKAELLAICYTGTEQFLGETDPYSKFVHSLSNPKRILRLQHVVEGGIVISLMVADLDFISSGGLLHVDPKFHYLVKEQSEETKVNLYEAYLDYFKRKVVNKAKEAGILMPPSASPFKK